jgi:hypothetical protein
MHNLSLASASLARFQHLAFPEPRLLSSETVGSLLGPPDRRLPALDTVLHGLRPASFPSPAPSPPYHYSPSMSAAPRGYNPPSRKRLHREDSPPSPRESFADSRPSPSPSLGSECCGGIMDCRDLVEREGDEISDNESSMSRMSQLRSTSTAPPSASYRSHR